MPEAKPALLTSCELAKSAKRIIADVLTTGDWEHSIFLKAAAAKLRKLMFEAERLSHPKG